MQLLFAKWVLNMEGNIASDIFMHVPGWHCCRCFILYRIGVLLAWEKHNHLIVIPDHVISIVPGSDLVNPNPVQDVVILFTVLVDARTMHSLLLLFSSDNLRLGSLMESVSNMLNGAGQNIHNGEFTAGCLQHLQPQLENGLEQHVGCVGVVGFSGWLIVDLRVIKEKVNCGSDIRAVALVDTDNIQNFICC